MAAHFGKEKFKKYKSKIEGCSYYGCGSQFEIDGLFFKFSFTYRDEILTRIDFEIETEPIERGWGHNRDFETAWIREQLNDTSEINDPNRFDVACNWGSMAVFLYDFKNGTYNTYLSYKH